MELRVFSPEMEFLGTIENQTSLVWTRKYRRPGNFELHIPITSKNIRLIKSENLLYKKGDLDAGIIEDIKLEENDMKNKMTVKGRFMTAYMDRRLIKNTVNFTGKVENAMRDLLTRTDPIPKVILGKKQGFEEAVQFQVTYKNLLEIEQKLATISNLGFRMRPDFQNRKIYFEIYQGEDRTIINGTTRRVIFSEQYENLNNAVYQENTQLYKTKAYVGGEGEGAARKYVVVGSGEGLNLREIFVDAKDLRSDDLGTEEYEKLLYQRGLEALEENIVTQSFECDTEANSNFVYQKDYDLGDIVVIQKNAWGVTINKRIEEISEIYEYGQMRVVPTFGSALPDTVDWS